MTVLSKASASRLGMALAFALACTCGGPSSAAVSQLEEEGRQLFAGRCAACHSLGGGALVGPDLQGVVERRPGQWLQRFIQEPDKLIASGDALAAQLLAQFNNVAMPNLGLSEDEVDALLAYLASAGAAKAGAQAASATAALPAGDAQAGRELFAGSVRFTEGGAACIGCHLVAGVGALGGGTLGPDLTGVYGRLGQAGLAASLKGLPFPSMREIFENRPLTEKEQADLLAFFAQAQGDQLAPAGSGFFLLGLGGSVVLAALLSLLWRNRFRGVRRDLIGGQP